MIATRKQPWGERSFLTRQEALSIHAFHSAAFWMAIFLSLCGSVTLVLLGFGAPFALVAFTAFLAFSATVAGTATDLMSMRIPDPITAAVLVAAVGWWIMEARGVAPTEGRGAARDVLGLILPNQGSGSAVPRIDGLFPGAWIALDIAAAVLVFIPLYYSFTLGLGFGGGDVKLMTALTFFLGWPLGFDFVILTYFFGGLVSVLIMLARLLFSLLERSGVKGALVSRISGIKSFAYAPAILLAALVCIAQKSEGFFQ